MISEPQPIKDGNLEASVPLLLLPMRLEIRFVDSSESSEILVRIYPDQISIDTHDPELTRAEIEDATDYWRIVWKSGNPPANDSDFRAAWRRLVTKYRAPRAAWIVLQTTPLNISLRPTAPTENGSDPVPKPSFPTPLTKQTSCSIPS